MKHPPVLSEDNLLTYEEAAFACRIGRDTLRECIHRRELRFVQLGPQTKRIRRSELERWWNAKSRLAGAPLKEVAAP